MRATCMGTLLSATLCLLAGCKVRQPSVSLADVGLKGIRKGNIELQLLFDVYNPNAYDIRLKSIAYDLSTGGVNVAQVTNEAPLVCSARTTSRVPTVAGISYRKMLEAVREFGASDSIEYGVDGKAVFDVLGVGVPVHIGRIGTMHQIHLPKWKLKDVRAPRRKGGPTIFVFDVTNLNRFDLPLDGLTGTLGVAGLKGLELQKPNVSQVAAGETVEVEIPIYVDFLSLALSLKTLLQEDNVSKVLDPSLQFDKVISLRKAIRRRVEETDE